MAVSVKAILGFDGKAFHAGIKKARTSLNSFAKGALKSQVAQSLSIGYITSQLQQVGSFADQVTKLAPALGMTTKELQEWEYVFARAGLELDDVADAFATLADRTEDALAGTSSMIEDFSLIGIGVEQLKGKNPVQLFELFADGVQKTTDTNRALSAIVRSLGDDLGRKLAPMLMLGSEGLKEMKDEAADLGLILNSDNLQEVTKAVTEMKIASMQLRSVWGGVYTMIAKVFTALKDGVSLLNPFDYIAGALGNSAALQDANPDKFNSFDPIGGGKLDAMMDGAVKTFDDTISTIGNRQMAEEEMRKPSSKRQPTREQAGITDAINLKTARDSYLKKAADASFKQLSNDQKINELLKQREEIEKRMAGTKGKEFFDLASQRIDLLQKEQAILTSAAAGGSGSGIRSQGLTSSQSVGAFVQRNNPLIGIARKQLMTQEQIRDALNNPRSNPTNNPHGTAGMGA